MGTPPPAGWFPSPDSDGMQRWWDGTGWTSFTRPTPTPADAPIEPWDSSLPTDPEEQLEKTSQALAALQQQGGLFGAFAAVASQALQSQLPPPTPTGPGVQPYGRPAFGASVPRSPHVYDVTDGQGPSVSWRVGSVSGGSDPDDSFVIHRRRRRRMGPVGNLLLGLAFLGLGLLFAILITNENSTHGDESTVRGIVISHEIRTDSDGDRLCSPVASFSVDGATYTAGSNISSSSCPGIGSPVTVIYTTAAPGDGDARVKSTGVLIWLIWLFPIVGLAITIFAIRRFGLVGRSIRALLPSRGL